MVGFSAFLRAIDAVMADGAEYLFGATPADLATLDAPEGYRGLVQKLRAGPTPTQGLAGTPVMAELARAARQLLARTGVVFRKTVTREKLPISWLALSRVYRRMELRGEIRGG